MQGGAHRSGARRLIQMICGIALLLLLATLVSAWPASASVLQNDAEQRNSYTISDNVDLVLLDVSVRDPRGGYVTGLTKNDFQVFDDGHQRPIAQFASVDTPVTVGLVVDNSGSMREKRPEVLLAGLAFAKESNPQDEFFVVNFNNHVTPGLPNSLPFTDDLQQLRSALYYGQAAGQTALYDAIVYALKHLELSHRDKRTLIVVSDGGDNVSETTLPELMRVAEASRATVYTVGLFGPDDRDRNPRVLKRLAATTGGQYFEPPELDDIIPVFKKISKDIRNRYTIGYVPEEVTDTRTIRSIKVAATDASHRKLIVHTRTSYIITPVSKLVSGDGEAENRRRQKQ